MTDVCRHLDISQATFHIWKSKYASRGACKVHKLRQFEDENARLKSLIGDLTLDKSIRQEVTRKRFEAFAPWGFSDLDSEPIPSQLCEGLQTCRV